MMAEVQIQGQRMQSLVLLTNVIGGNIEEDLKRV
jgi:hypothetical protein